MIAVVKAASAKSKSKYVFPAITTNAKHHTGLTRWLQKIAAKDVPGITSNGLRHSFSSTAEDLGYSLPTIKALVGHSRASVTEGYIHKIDSALLAAADRIARHIDDAMTGRKSNKVGPPHERPEIIGAARVAPEKLVRTSLPRRPHAEHQAGGALVGSDSKFAGNRRGSPIGGLRGCVLERWPSRRLGPD